MFQLRNITRLYLVLAIGFWFVACNTNGCLENRNSVPKAGFYSSAGSMITLDSVQVMGLSMKADSVLCAAGTRVSSLYLPMRSTEPSTGWVFSYKWKYLDSPSLNDTIIFHYDSEPYFSSSECGVIYKYHIRRVQATYHLIDSVVLADSVITNVDKEQIKIYFRTAEDDAKTYSMPRP